ncbi:MAG: alginate export family protein [Gammaproteobacteria bacterium]|nr:alginate export family protein [Gammaproteobacteria bacterium]
MNSAKRKRGGHRLAAGAGTLLAMMATGVAAETLTEQIAASVKASTVNLGFRYRFEAVDDDAFSEDAWANTLRSRLTLAPQPISGFGVLVEIDDVRNIGAEKFNDTRNGVTDRPSVIDPEGTDLNQALLRYTGFAGTEITVGRQRIERNNQRFVGGVGWRQNEQTYDAATISHKFGDKLTASYTFVGQVNRIFGPEKGTPPRDLDTNTNLVDVSYALAPALNLAGYWYQMDFDNADSFSNETYGLRATGAIPVSGEWKFGYTAEFATQSEEGDNPVDYDADYYLVEAGIGQPKLGLKAGYEVLEGDTAAGSAFRTPLATLHAFQGWADQFLATPNGGIEDLYVAVTGKALGADWVVTWHDFSAETGSQDWGTELDVSANWPLAKHYAVLLKGATYDSDVTTMNPAQSWTRDTSKYWLMLTATF